MILRLQSSWEIRESVDGTCELISAFLQRRLRISSKYRSSCLILKELQKGFDYPEDLAKLSEKYGVEKDALELILSKLRKQGLLIEEDTGIPSEPQEAIYDRQIRFFRGFETQDIPGDKLHKNLQNRTVFIAGLGGYGSWTALLCARMGVRNIVGVDFDHVEVTNLHRQVLYNREDLGKSKVDACRKKIQDCDPDIQFSGHNIKIERVEDLYPLIGEADLVLNPFSYLPTQKAMNHPAGIIARAALAKCKPCLTFGGSWIGPLTIPQQTPCYFCALSKLADHSGLDPESRNPRIQKRAFAPPIVTCCSLAVFEASRFLSRCDQPQTLKGILQHDILTFGNSRFLPIERDPECHFCSPHTTSSKADL